MATAQIVFGRVGYIGSGDVPVMDDETIVSETMTVNGTAASSTAVAPSVGGKVGAKVVADAACWVSYGTAPNANTDTTTRYYLPANVIDTVVVTAGDKVSVRTVAP